MDSLPAGRLEVKRADKIERILDAGLRLFAERGYSGAAMPEIAKAAEVAPATIYRYFENKEALVNAVFRRSKGRLGALLRGALEAGAGSAEALFHEVFARVVRFSRERPEDFAFLELQDHVPYLDAQSRAEEAAVLVPLAAAIAGFAARGEIAGVVRPEVLIGTVWGALVGLVKASRLGYLVLSERDLEDVSRALFRGLSGGAS